MFLVMDELPPRGSALSPRAPYTVKQICWSCFLLGATVRSLLTPPPAISKAGLSPVPL